MSKARAFATATGGIALLLLLSSPAYSTERSQVPTFYRDVQPILEKHCQNCHRPGEMAFPLMAYDQAAPRARAIAESAVARKMPPWLADPATATSQTILLSRRMRSKRCLSGLRVALALAALAKHRLRLGRPKAGIFPRRTP